MDAYFGGISNKKNNYRGRVPSASGGSISPALKNVSRGTAILRASAIRAGIEAFIEKLLCILDVIIDVISSSKAIAVVRASVSVVCLFAVIGVIGGIESGTISWGTGIIIAFIAAAAETVCIRKFK